jgi:hypothetical protein
MSVRQAHPVIAMPRSSIEPLMVGEVGEGGGIMFMLFSFCLGDLCGILVKLRSFRSRRKKHVWNLFWGNGTENTARRVSSRQL